ncbi:MAG: hypothetical protein AW07_03861 [Candidatus Accumulibacter sp. SK-11]|nr:MAG: hypothetical protein AW07_03861 [Candidatus Accumulibacter sp. SK-11]
MRRRSPYRPPGFCQDAGQEQGARGCRRERYRADAAVFNVDPFGASPSTEEIADPGIGTYAAASFPNVVYISAP